MLYAETSEGLHRRMSFRSGNSPTVRASASVALTCAAAPAARMPQIPFVKRAPMVTFRKPIGSISVSGHKFVGSPVPCGVVMTRLR